MSRIHRLALPAVALALATSARAADFAGTYRGDVKGQPSTVELTHDGTAYAGTIRLGTLALPCHANADGDHLAGTFASGGHAFPFTAALAGDTLSLSTAGATYTLTRPPVNPLDAPAAPPVGASAAVMELAHTATGRAVVLHQPAATTADDALTGALPRLAGTVGGDLTVTGRFHDTKQPDRGGATFTARVDGHAVRGVAFCGRSVDGGTDVSVAYAAADAPPADWATLTAALPHQTALKPYEFPDGTGTIGVPDGWTCKAQSACDPIFVDGPENQRVAFGQCVTINGQQSPLAQTMRRTEELRQQNQAMMRQMNDRLRQMGGRPAPPPPMRAPPSPTASGIFFGEPGDDPVAMFRDVYPQLSECSVANHGPPEQIDQILATTPAPAQVPNGHAALLSMLWSTGGTTPEHFRYQGRIEAAPIGTAVTLLMSSGLRAHADTFDRDLPTLWAITQSFKPDQAKMNEVSQQRCQQIAEAGRRQMEVQNQTFRQNQQAMFERNQAFHDQQAESFDRTQRSIENQSTASHRAAADFSEMIGGYQKVVNTRTGEEKSVDYYNSTGIVNGLNEQAGDNAEWVAVHQRDERYPLGR